MKIFILTLIFFPLFIHANDNGNVNLYLNHNSNSDLVPENELVDKEIHKSIQFIYQNGVSKITKDNGKTWIKSFNKNYSSTITINYLNFKSKITYNNGLQWYELDNDLTIKVNPTFLMIIFNNTLNLPLQSKLFKPYEIRIMNSKGETVLVKTYDTHSLSDVNSVSLSTIENVCISFISIQLVWNI